MPRSPEEQAQKDAGVNFRNYLLLHPADFMSPPNEAREQLHTIKTAKAGLKYAKAKRDVEEIDDLTRQFAALSLNDGSVMAAVRNRSIFRTDR